MAGYQFGPNERVVLRAQDVKVKDRESRFSYATGSELMLTSENIVYQRKGVFGKTKGYDVYPLARIRLIDGVPQCRLDTSEFMVTKLEISFEDSLVAFAFGSLEARAEVRSWINEINLILVGAEASEENLRATGVGAFTDGDAMVESFGKLFGSFEGAFEGAFKRKVAKAAPVVAYRCPSCNASLKGKQGSTVTCPFCGSNVTIPLDDPFDET